MTPLEHAFRDASWHAEPPAWSWEDGALSVVTGHETDFWQGTLYGFRRDDGHFLGRPVETDFTAVLDFEARYETLYDQAGLMLRLDARNWLKTGIEYSDGVTNFSVVVTRDGWSDWSVVPTPGLSGVQRIRLTRLDGAAIVHCRGGDGAWHLMRVAALPGDGDWQVGPMTCSPTRAGFEVRFRAFSLTPPVENPLHAD